MDTTNFKYETDILLKEYFATEDEEARKKIVSGIIELNYRLIYKIVEEDWDWCDDFEELINVAIIAIMEKPVNIKSIADQIIGVTWKNT